MLGKQAKTRDSQNSEFVLDIWKVKEIQWYVMELFCKSLKNNLL